MTYIYRAHGRQWRLEGSHWHVLSDDGDWELWDLGNERDVALVAEIDRLAAIDSELTNQRGRLEQLLENYQPGMAEYRLAEALLGALDGTVKGCRDCHKRLKRQG